MPWDPKIDNSAIAVSADDGRVTLRGTVGSLREKREAKNAAARVFGVVSVDNQLEVPPESRRPSSATPSSTPWASPSQPRAEET
jgi:hypothetical protein